jgi:ABC-type uncharacterized transport system ATPase subunit
MSALLNIENISVAYGQVSALRDLSMAVNAGGCLLGPRRGLAGREHMTLSDHAAYARRATSHHQRCCIG